MPKVEPSPYPNVVSDEQWSALMQEAGKQDMARAKRSAKSDARRSERLARPPADHEDAWWRHVETCPFPPHTSNRKAWLKANPTFEFEGRLWTRTVSPTLSNSGRTVAAWNPTYVRDDGVVVSGHRPPPKRRNDPKRDFGLPG